MATKFLKIKSSGTLASKELDCGVLRFENSNRALNHTDTPANIDTAAEFKTLLFILELGGANVTSSKVICFNLGTANRADAATNAQLSVGNNKTITHVDINTSTIADTSTFNDFLTLLKAAVDSAIAAEPSAVNIKTAISTATNDKKLIVWNASQSGVDADRPKWSLVSNPAENSFTAIDTSASGSFASHIETYQYDEAAPTGGATYYLNANKTLVGYGTGVKEHFTAADDATGKWYTDKENDVVYISNGITKFIVQDGSADGDVAFGYADKCARQVNALRTFDFQTTNSSGTQITINGVARTDKNNPQDSRFFDAVKNDGLWPGDPGAGQPSALRGDFLGNRSRALCSALTPTLVEAGTEVNNATTSGSISSILNETQKVNRSVVESSKVILELDLPTLDVAGRQNHILTY